jgi:butyryl-CoA dehydrogenase
MKGWLTERSISITSDGIQIHGGMGFIEETGAAQHYRDARILTIYEGTTAIQANDLLHRKILRDEAKNILELINDINKDAESINQSHASLNFSSKKLLEATDLVKECIQYILNNKESIRELSAISVPLLMMMGTLCGGWMTLRSADAASKQKNSSNWSSEFLEAKLKYNHIYSSHCLPNIHKYCEIIKNGGEPIESITPEMLWT